MDPILSTILTTVVTGLIGAITILWRKQCADNAMQDQKHAECERDREVMRSGLNTVSQQVGFLHACPMDPCGAREAIQRQKTFSLNQSQIQK